METLGIKAIRFANEIVKNVNHPDKSLFRDLIALSYNRGAEDEREDMGRWLDPKEELPRNSRRVIVLARQPNGAEFVTGGWHDPDFGEEGWNIDLETFAGLRVIYWRPIIWEDKI